MYIRVAEGMDSKSKRKIFILGGLIGVVVIFGYIFFLVYSYYQTGVVVTAPERVLENTDESEGVNTEPVVDSNLPKGVVPIPTQVGAVLDKAFVSKGYGFQISPPVGWSTDDSGSTKAVVVFMNKKGEKIGDRVFTSYITVTVGDASSVDLKEKVKESKLGLSKSFQDYTITEDKEVMINGKMNYVIGGNYKVDGVIIRNRNLLTISGGKGYAVSMYSTQKGWDTDAESMNASMFSLRLF